MKFTTEFLNGYLSTRKINKELLSTLIKHQILKLLNSDSPARIVEEIAYLEGFGKTTTETETRFTGNVLKGFNKKHYYSPAFIGQNLLNLWKLNPEQEKSKKFADMALRVSKPYSQNGFLPGNDRPTDQLRFSSDLAETFMEGYKDRASSRKLTGEWIIFKQFNTKNYYLTLANHSEQDENILERINLCKSDFPFLFI